MLGKYTRNAAIRTGMTLVAGATARFLATLSPEKARGIIKDPKALFGIKIPSEFTATLGGGAAGLTAVGLLKTVVPGIGDNVLDLIQDFAIMVGEEYEDVVRRQGSQPTQAAPKGGSTMTMFPAVWIEASDPLTGYAEGCHLAHHLEEVTSGKKRKPQAGPEVDETKFAPKSGFRQVGFESYVRSGAKPPAVPEPGCTCRIILDESSAEYHRQKDEQAKVSAPPSTNEKAEASMVGFLGRAAVGKIKGVSKEDAKRLADLIQKLPADKVNSLNEITSDMELAGLCLAGDVDQLTKLIDAAKDRIERSRWMEFLNLPPAAASKVKKEFDTQWGNLRTWSKDTGAKLDKATEDLKKKRANRRAAAVTVVPPPQKTLRQKLRDLPRRLSGLALHGTW